MMMPTNLRAAALRLLLAVLIAVAPAGRFARADTADSWSLTQSAPGVVTASGRLPGVNHAQPRDFSLRLPGAQDVPASAVAIQAAGPAPDVWLVLCIDRSGSMASGFPEMKAAIDEASRNALAAAGGRLRIQVLPFATSVESASEFSNAPDDIAAAVGTLTPQRTSDSISRLYDAVAAGLRSLEQKPGAAVRRLVVISDGKDEGSVSQLEDVAAEARRLAVELDAIAYGALADSASTSLRPLAQASGGGFTPAGGPTTLAQVIGRTLNQDAPPLLSVEFRYPAALDQPRVDVATLVHTPAGLAPLSLAVHLDAPIAAPVSSTIPNGARDAVESPARPIRWWRDARLIALALAAATAVSVIVVVQRRHTLAILVPHGVGPKPVDPPLPTPPPRTRQRTMISPSFPPPRRGQPAAWLVTVGGPQNGYRFPIEKDLVRLGAGAANELVLGDDERISGQHASIRYEANNLYLQDLRSLNGTYLNEQRLTGPSRALAPGDRIRLGATNFELQTA